MIENHLQSVITLLNYSDHVWDHFAFSQLWASVVETLVAKTECGLISKLIIDNVSFWLFFAHQKLLHLFYLEMAKTVPAG